MTALNLSTDVLAPGEPITDSELTGVLHMQGFQPAGVPFTLAMPRVLLPKDFSSVSLEKFSLSFGALEAAGGVDGTLGEKPKLAGTIESNEFELRGLLASVGIDPPETTDPHAFGKVQLRGSWSFDDGVIGIDPIALSFDDTHFRGNFRRGSGADPVGVFALHGDTLNISRYVPPPDPSSEPFVLPTAALKNLKFRGVLELENATLDDIVMKGVTLRLLLDERGLRGDTKLPTKLPGAAP